MAMFHYSEAQTVVAPPASANILLRHSNTVSAIILFFLSVVSTNSLPGLLERHLANLR